MIDQKANTNDQRYARYARFMKIVIAVVVALGYGLSGGFVRATGPAPLILGAPAPARSMAPNHTNNLPLCPTGNEYDAGLCYPVCRDGFTGVGPVCWSKCPDGYIDDGALCRKDAIIIPKNSYGRGAGTPMGCGTDEDQNGALCYPKCNAGFTGVGPVCWSNCPANYTDTGAFCTRGANTINKDSYGRGAGTIPTNIFTHECPSGKEYDAGLCYTVCQAGYVGVGPVCWATCPAGYTDTGATCFLPADTITKSSYGRGAGSPLHTCGAGLEQDGGLCYPVCDTGFTGIGPVCWGTCPSGYTDDGALCRKDAIIITKDSYGRGAGSVPNCDINNLDCSGNFEVYSTFRPKPWGYNFENWGQKDDYPNNSDLDTATLIRMFGSGVCQTGSTAGDCVLKASARSWRDTELSSANGGHCYGLAVSAQQFFAGTVSPSKFQSDATGTYDLKPSTAVRANITEMFVTQGLSPANGSGQGFVGFGTHNPSQILELIRTNLRDTPNDPYVLAIYKTDEMGKITGGHAVTPFAIEDKGSGEFWVHIYDNNWPNTDRYIVFNTTAETWLYGFGATNPTETKDAWKGDASTKTLQVRLTSAHLLSGWSCPFCNQVTARNTYSLRKNDVNTTTIDFGLSGGGDLLIRDSQGHGAGWDYTTNSYTNTIPDANLSYAVGGSVGVIATSNIRVPVTISSTTPYSAVVSGFGLTHTVMVQLAVTGPSFTLNVKDIALSPSQVLLMTIRPDGRQVTFSADAVSNFTPTFSLANDGSASGNGYMFDVGGITLAPSTTVTVSLDMNGSTLHFKDNTPQSTRYNVDMLRITPQGADQHFSTSNAALTGGQEGIMNFGTWDGRGAIPFTLNGNTQLLNNDALPKLYLPYLTRG